jgi:hypothetical protein
MKIHPFEEIEYSQDFALTIALLLMAYLPIFVESMVQKQRQQRLSSLSTGFFFENPFERET